MSYVCQVDISLAHVLKVEKVPGEFVFVFLDDTFTFVSVQLLALKKQFLP